MQATWVAKVRSFCSNSLCSRASLVSFGSACSTAASISGACRRSSYPQILSSTQSAMTVIWLELPLEGSNYTARTGT